MSRPPRKPGERLLRRGRLRQRLEPFAAPSRTIVNPFRSSSNALSRVCAAARLCSSPPAPFGARGTVLNKALLASLSPARSRAVVVTALGVTQIFAWGCSYYLIAVLAEPIAVETGWAQAWIVGGVSLGLLTAGAISPWVGRAIAALGGRPVLAVKRGISGDGPPGAGAGAIASGLCGGLAGDWIGHGRGPLRSGLCDSRAPLRPWRTLGDHHADAVRRLRQHDMLASFSVSRSPSGMARRVCGLRRLPALRRAADLFSRRAA